jgi:KUP system potassium uptake protein
VAVGLTAAFLIVDLAFFGANIIKIPAGGWVPLVAGIMVFAVMTTWRRGRGLLTATLRRGELPIERFIGSIATHPQQRVPGTAVYLFPDPGATPPALLANLRHNGVLHETVIIVAVKTADVPHVPQARRATLHHHGEGFHEVMLQFGFMDAPDVPTALANIVTGEFGFDPTDATFVLGRETVVSSGSRGMAPWRRHLFAAVHRNAASAVEHFQLPRTQVIEIGTQIEI